MVINRVAWHHSTHPLRFSRGRMLVAAATVAAIAISVTSVLWSRAGTGGGSDGAANVYRYRFERTTHGSITRAVDQEIAFYQERTNRDPQGGLDLAALAGVYLKKARLTGQTHWYLLAEQTARRSLANLPFSNNGAILVLAKVAEARHDFGEAIRLADRLSGHPDAMMTMASSHLAMGEVAEAAQLADLLVARTPSMGAYTLRALANLARGDDAQAVEDFQRALALEEPGEQSTSAWVRTLLGRFHLHRGRLDEAGLLFAEALRILPQYPLALVYQAELETRLGRYEQAAHYYWQVLAVSPGASYPLIFDHVAMQGLARVKILQGDQAAAEELWDKAESIIRGHLTAFGHRRELVRLLLERGRADDLPEALALMQEEIHIRRDAETLDTLAWALTRVGRWREARDVIRDALGSGVKDARLLYRAGVIEQALGNHPRARLFFRSAVDVDPTFDARVRRSSELEE